MPKKKNKPIRNKLVLPALILSLLLAIGSGTVTIFALRSNNEHMANLRTAVYQADKSGINVAGALNNLQAYVTSHMNTNLSDGAGSVYPPIQLEYTYQRLVQAQTQASLSSNQGLYTAAQAYCQKLDPYHFSGGYRVSCIDQYVTSHGSGTTQLPSIPPSLYEFDFISPTWSPDLAGWMLLISVFFVVVTLLISVMFVYQRFSKRD